MQMTIRLDDELGERLKEEARRQGKSLSVFLAQAGREALGKGSDAEEPPFRLITYRGSGTVQGFDLDRTSDLLAAEDQQNFGDRST
jgi:hypothetical protein